MGGPLVRSLPTARTPSAPGARSVAAPPRSARLAPSTLRPPAAAMEQLSDRDAGESNP